MTSQILRFPTLSDTLWRDSSAVRNLALVVLGVVLLTISAKTQIPFYPVPLTMQTFVVLAMGMIYGWKLGAFTIAAYLFAGSFGLPIFSGTPEKGLGLAYMSGPTGGYLIGFVLAAGLTGWLAERGWDRRISSTFLAMLFGNIVIYIPGLIWLANVVGWDKPVLDWGLTPFLFGDLAKILLAIVVIPGAWKVINNKSNH